ncbi:flagellar motor protein [Ectothiorhodospira haloalkaliphila]|uniref:Flagellar motor protein n=1 Tax=Ectothiorhodospira haloalkaliphila TaxID=421628 RepID=W8L4J2_9GAMM|nr:MULTISPECIES: flagellar motor protein [Ectothiorhodospira]AHK78840.1 flagellar motor protein [Ectothiorhodospira haloalkaliphila]MCG5494043.1 flagellar motor protein [Ectothiorhodospira variabilis]MCG5498024.1 flagellar motor protein [Ectothiorhodospira variabilis]MCG5503427.1 flagellar motor protein [Ectothiorhodospira variabilis]MCG5506485.1 flagellar motor protein [Ectothiorhodospira variabilis]
MDILSLIGVMLALVAVFGGTIAKGSGLAALWNGAAFVIVILGTIAAALVQTRPAVFMRAFRILPWVFVQPRLEPEATIEKIVSWSQVARKEGLLGLESLAEEETDVFSKKGLQLLVDGTEPDNIRTILEVEMGTKEDFDTQAAKVFESMGIYAPTMGIVGAVMGLMAVMQNLADPSRLGAGIAAAFVATIYGIASANLFFLPMSNKLKTTIQNQSAHREMIVEGIISIAEGENPRNIETKLQGYLQR